MDPDAYMVLDALGRGAHAELTGLERWVDALKTIRWAVEGRGGPMLTAEGRQARDQLARERAAQTPHPAPGAKPAARSNRAGSVA